MQKSNQAARGFTTVELLVTLAIAAIVLGLGIPSLRDFMTANRLTSNVNSMVALINYARSEAIARNQVVVICPKTNGADTCVNSQYWAEYEILAFVDTNANNQRNSGEPILKTIPAMDSTSSIFRMNKSGSHQYMTFETLGYSRETATISIYNEGDAAYQFKYGRTLCVSKPGRVRAISYGSTCNAF